MAGATRLAPQHLIHTPLAAVARRLVGAGALQVVCAADVLAGTDAGNEGAECRQRDEQEDGDDQRAAAHAADRDGRRARQAAIAPVRSRATGFRAGCRHGSRDRG